jgi:hypothetical protein
MPQHPVLRSIAYIVVVSSFGLALSGCNFGMQPEGPSPDQIRANMSKMPPDEQIKLIQHSPMPKEQQQQEIAKIRAQFHLPDPGNAPDTTPGQG